MLVCKYEDIDASDFNQVDKSFVNWKRMNTRFLVYFSYYYIYISLFKLQLVFPINIHLCLHITNIIASILFIYIFRFVIKFFLSVIRIEKFYKIARWFI